MLTSTKRGVGVCVWHPPAKVLHPLVACLGYALAIEAHEVVRPYFSRP